MAHSRAWTAERIALFETIHEQMPKAIWEAVNALPGPQLTKSAVIGRRDRRHGMVRRPPRTQEEIAASLLARREREILAQRARRAANGAKTNYNRREAAKEREAKGGDPGPYQCVEAQDIVPLNIGLMDLQEGDCRWPYAAELGAAISHVFCGHQAITGRPYCKGHAAIALKQPKERTRPGYIELGRSHGGVFGRVG
jgi:hypothetical protein